MTNKKYYKHPSYGTVYAESVPTPQGRFAWPYLTKPKDPPKGKDGVVGSARYEVVLVLPKSNPKVQTFLDYIKSETVGMLKTFNEGSKAKIAIDTYLQDGDNYDAEKYPYYVGSWVLVARNVKLPTIVDDAKGEIEPSSIKGGMIGKLMVTPLITSHGLSYKLEVVQFLKDDGTRFAGGSGRDMSALLNALDDEDSADSAEEAAEAEETPAEPTPAPKAPVAKAAAQKGKAAALARL